jgi:hypothetical protein
VNDEIWGDIQPDLPSGWLLREVILLAGKSYEGCIFVEK